MGLSGTLGKRFVFQIESQTGKPLRKKQTKDQPITLLKLFKRPMWYQSFSLIKLKYVNTFSN